MRISDWSSDVCSSDLASRRRRTNHRPRRPAHCGGAPCCWRSTSRTRLRRVAFLQDGLTLLAHQRPKLLALARAFAGIRQRQQDRKNVVEGKSVYVRFELGGLRLLKKNNTKTIL